MKRLLFFFSYLFLNSLSVFSQPIPPDPGIIVAIPVIYFNAKLEGEIVKLIWQTETSKPSGSFDLQYSTDARNWLEVLENNNNESNYTQGVFHTSHSVLHILANSIYYRLKNVNPDGNIYYSKNLSVELIAPKKFLNSFHLNSKRNLELNLNADIIETIEIAFYNLLGQNISKETITTEIGNSNYEITLNNVTKGMHVFEIKSSSINIAKKILIE